MNDDLVDLKEVARRLGVCRCTIRKWTNDGRLPCIRTLGGHRRFRVSDIDRILKGAMTDEPTVDG